MRSRGEDVARAECHSAGYIPTATYRLQFNNQFTFAQAIEVADYLCTLGISDCYASPLFQAVPGSTHGYDVCSFEQINLDLGGTKDFESFVHKLQNLGLGLLLDMVPNHMGASLSNAWWRDVLERGPHSRYAAWFDIDWTPFNAALHAKILLPVLEARYADVLEAGKLRLVLEEDRLAVAYYDSNFPLSPESCRALLQGLPVGWDGAFKLNPSAESRKIISELLTRLNGRPGDPSSFDDLHSLLQHQHYRLAFSRSGLEQINYRRFFDVPELVSLRMELPEVFQTTHELLLRLVREGKVSGLRIDHPDGLWEPKQYFERLRDACEPAPSEKSKRPLYVVAEKILVGDEALPQDWRVEGTTGYDFLNRVNGLFVDSSNTDAFARLYREFTGQQAEFKTLVHRSKRWLLQHSFRSELNALTAQLKALAGSTRYWQDFTARELREAMTEVIAAFPVYRTYIGSETSAPSATERDFMTQAIASARNQRQDIDAKVFEFLAQLLQLDFPVDLNKQDKIRARNLVMKFQQLTGPVMAKGLEDTAFYNFNQLISLNEVGGSSDRFGISVDDFHTYNLNRAKHWPHTLLATATHDTKRGEDARMRLNVLSEVPSEWRDAVLRWQQLNADKKSLVNQHTVPDPNDEYLLYQTLVGAWLPDAETSDGLKSLIERICAYTLKALREAKAHTSWTEPNLPYEEATQTFIRQLLRGSSANPFLDDFKQFHRKISFFGHLNSLAQVLLKLTAPGVPDFYQGTELWDFNLVDPDNRRPVDFGLRRRMLIDLEKRFNRAPPDKSQFLTELLSETETGESKLYVIWRALQFRHAHRELFDYGAYVPLSVSGPSGTHICSFARILDEEISITIAPRLMFRLNNGTMRLPVGCEVWNGTALRAPAANAPLTLKSGHHFRNVFTGEIIPHDERGSLPVADALATFPIAILSPI